MDNLPSFPKEVPQTTAPSASQLGAPGGTAGLGLLRGTRRPRSGLASVSHVRTLSLWGSSAEGPPPQTWAFDAVVSPCRRLLFLQKFVDSSSDGLPPVLFALGLYLFYSLLVRWILRGERR